jgi:hypothetical protein
MMILNPRTLFSKGPPCRFLASIAEGYGRKTTADYLKSLEVEKMLKALIKSLEKKRLDPWPLESSNPVLQFLTGSQPREENQGVENKWSG